MEREDILKEKYGGETGFSVPPGYFESLNAKIMADLPAYPEIQRKVEMTRWQRLKPYVYLAAMFAGIWLMMNMFNHLSGGFGSVSLDNPPEQIAYAMADYSADSYNHFVSQTSFELESEITDAYSSMSDFEQDFGYDFSPEYANMDVDFPTSESDGGRPV